MKTQHREHAGPALAKAGVDGIAPTPCGQLESGTRIRVAAATVLLADDDEGVRCVLKDLLTGEGYAVVEAADGAAALELLASAADGGMAFPDVVLLDFMMPGFSGLGILRVMRRLSRMPPTIIMTGFPDPSVDVLARNLGAVRVLRKPLAEARLKATVLECVLLPARVG
jgi:CheY-like chemotaxis protein